MNYFHIVFSVPHELVALIWQNKRTLFHLLFEACAATMLEIGSEPKRLGVEVGLLSIPHTWGQTLQPHPHLHCDVPGGGPSADHTRWIGSRPRFFLPVKVLSRVFRRKFTDGLRHAFRDHQLAFFGDCAPLTNEKNFAAFLETISRKQWVVYAKPPFGGPQHVLHYLPRYTHRVAISNHRLLSVDDNTVTFRWKDYAHQGQEPHHDSIPAGVPAPVLTACAAKRLSPHSLLRMDGQPAKIRFASPLPLSAGSAVSTSDR